MIFILVSMPSNEQKTIQHLPAEILVKHLMPLFPIKTLRVFEKIGNDHLEACSKRVIQKICKFLYYIRLIGIGLI